MLFVFRLFAHARARARFPAALGRHAHGLERHSIRLGAAALRRLPRLSPMSPLRSCWFMSSRPSAASSAITISATSCATMPSAGWRPPSTTPTATSSARSTPAWIASATSTSPTPPSSVGDYTANPDHKSIPVRECRRTIGSASSIRRTATSAAGSIRSASICLASSRSPTRRRSARIALRRPSLGVGGSTLPMQIRRA